eukprot:COSAG02_NODE_3286_length_7006_cov_2.000434_5_plen_55_part_00
MHAHSCHVHYYTSTCLVQAVEILRPAAAGSTIWWSEFTSLARESMTMTMSIAHI